jgi:hypothetical protein
VSATVLVGRLQGSLQDYAQVYVAGKAVSSSQPETRQGAQGVSYVYTSESAQKRHRLLLLEDGGSAYGLYAEGETRAFEREAPVLQEMFASFALERPAAYAEHRDTRGDFSIRLPPSWKSTRTLEAGGKRVVQFLGPPMMMNRDRQTIHASLTVSAEPLSGEGLEDFYAATRRLLGSSYQLLDHVRWKDGYADVMRAETPMAASRLRRFYRVSGERAYSLSFEAHEDLFQDVVAWFDLIAGTFRMGPELAASGPR